MDNKTDNEIAGAAANATFDGVVGQLVRQLASANAQIAVLQSKLKAQEQSQPESTG